MGQRKNGEDRITIDYYQGAYGPTIRIDIQTMQSLVTIKNIFLQLAESKKKATDLVTVESVHATGVDQLILKDVSPNQERAKKLQREKDNTKTVTFYWSMSRPGWQRCAGLIDGLIESQRAGHQYLTDEGVDDALVEVAFME